MAKALRVAMIGCGRRARQHVEALRADERCEVVAAADVKCEAAEAMRDAFGGGPAVYTDYEEMLRREKPDMVVGCLWTRLHVGVFKDSVKAGVRLYHSEKPMAVTWGDCLEMARVAEESGCQLTFCHQRRFKKGNRIARELIGEGVFGRLLRMDLYSPPNLLDCGTHTFDQALSFNGETPAAWVLGAVDVTKPIKWFDVHAEEMAVGIVHFENGVRANIQVGGPDKDMGSGVRVLGEKGFLEVGWDGQFSAGVVYADPAWRPPVWEQSEDECMTDLVRDLVDSLETGREPELGYRKALRASEIIFALYESVRRRARVTLPIEIRDNPFLTMLEAGAFAGCGAARES
jgi:predicted dehydrogenase